MEGVLGDLRRAALSLRDTSRILLTLYLFSRPFPPPAAPFPISGCIFWKSFGILEFLDVPSSSCNIWQYFVKVTTSDVP